MKKGILFLLLAATVTAHAQSLKDLLYSGKLKVDSNTVVRKSDDLSSKIDTATKKQADAEKPKVATLAADSTNRLNIHTDSGSAALGVRDTTATTVSGTENNLAKNNNKIWKEYMDSLVSTLKTDVLPSKKIKSGTYYLYVDYEIGTDGQVSITNVVSSPENSFLQDQVKERLLLGAPQLVPVLDSSNKPRKVKRKYNFNITKE